MGLQFEFACVDLGAVLGALQVADFRREAVDVAVESPDLRSPYVDEAPEHGLAFVGDLQAIRGDATGQDAELFADGFDRFVAVPDASGVELVASRGCAVECGVFADDCGVGLCLMDVVGIEHGCVSLGSFRF